MEPCRSAIERLIPSLRQVARALVGHNRPDLADDLVHEALDDALRSERGMVLDDVELRLYGRLVAANRARLRIDWRERRTSPGGTARGEPRPARAGMGASLGGTGQGLDALPLADREVMVLVVLARLDYAKVAEVVGIPPNLLVTRLTQARDGLGPALWAGAGRAARPSGTSHLRLVKS